MCRCYVCDLDWHSTASQFVVDQIDQSALPAPSYRNEPRGNIAVVVENNQSQRLLSAAHWSLIPRWSQQFELTYPTYNARIESAGAKPTFAQSTRSMRAIIPANGYYEWHGQRPYYFHDPDSPVLAMAGLYSLWRPDSSTTFRLTTTILTTKAQGEAARVHDRMPVLLAQDAYASWLDPTVDGSTLMEAVQSSATLLSSQLEMYEVEPLKGDGPQLIKATGIAPEHRRSSMLTLFE